MGRDHPPAITHPEYFYGFVGIGLVWQIAFLVIARDPVRYRSLMLVVVLEKASFFLATVTLYALGRLHLEMVAAGGLDMMPGGLFLVAYLRTPRHSPGPGVDRAQRGQRRGEPDGQTEDAVLDPVFAVVVLVDVRDPVRVARFDQRAAELDPNTPDQPQV